MGSKRPKMICPPLGTYPGFGNPIAGLERPPARRKGSEGRPRGGALAGGGGAIGALCARQKRSGRGPSHPGAGRGNGSGRLACRRWAGAPPPAAIAGPVGTRSVPALLPPLPAELDGWPSRAARHRARIYPRSGKSPAGAARVARHQAREGGPSSGPPTEGLESPRTISTSQVQRLPWALSRADGFPRPSTVPVGLFSAFPRSLARGLDEQVGAPIAPPQTCSSALLPPERTASKQCACWRPHPSERTGHEVGRTGGAAEPPGETVRQNERSDRESEQGGELGLQLSAGPLRIVALVVVAGLTWIIVSVLRGGPGGGFPRIQQLFTSPEDSVTAEPRARKYKCGLPQPCPEEHLAFRVVSGAANVIGPKICLEDKMLMSSVKDNVGRGLNIALVNGVSGELIEARAFDMWAGDVNDLLKFIRPLHEGTLVFVASYDDPATKMNEETRKLFSDLGSKNIKDVAFRDSWVFVGAKGVQNKSPFEQHMKNSKHTNKYEGWPGALDMEGCVPKRTTAS